MAASFAALTVAAYAGLAGRSSLAGAPTTERILFAQFGAYADTIYEVHASDPSRRHKVLEVRHAPEFGIVPAISPDGRSFAYTLLPTGTLNPTPGSPAELWVASIDGTARRLGRGYDLLVKPLWRADSEAVVVRRGDGEAGPYELVAVQAASGAEVSLVSSSSALFPVAFTPNGLYYASVDERGTDLWLVAKPGAPPAILAHLSDGLTRDWTLSPSGDRLAFLALVPLHAGYASKVLVLDLSTGSLAATGAGDADEFAPAWTPDGRLTFGSLGPSAAPAGVSGAGGLPRPALGFDAPLAWSRSSGALVLRMFEGPSLMAPGRTALVLATPQGRRIIANGEVTFIGWTYR